MGTPEGSQRTDDGSATRDDPGCPDGRQRRSLLERAGVIGAESIAPDDPGHRLIPASGPTPPASPTATDDARPSAGIPADEIERWTQVGASPSTAATLRRLGVDPDEVDGAPVSADELVGWLWHGFAVDEIGEWLVHGSVRVAARLRDAGATPGDAGSAPPS